jgi:hypothetical protein
MMPPHLSGGAKTSLWQFLSQDRDHYGPFQSTGFTVPNLTFQMSHLAASSSLTKDRKVPCRTSAGPSNMLLSGKLVTDTQEHWELRTLVVTHFHVCSHMDVCARICLSDLSITCQLRSLPDASWKLPWIFITHYFTLHA